MLKGLVAGGGRTKNTLTITVENGTEKQVYTVNVYRSMSLSAVSFTSDSGTELEFEPVFSEKTRMYTLTVPADAESITADMTSGYVDGNTCQAVDPAQATIPSLPCDQTGNNQQNRIPPISPNGPQVSQPLQEYRPT